MERIVHQVSSGWHSFPRCLGAHVADRGRAGVAIVYPEGREIVAAPRSGALAFFEHLLTRRREFKQDLPAVPCPADYRVEIRARQLAAG